MDYSEVGRSTQRWEKLPDDGQNNEDWKFFKTLETTNK